MESKSDTKFKVFGAYVKRETSKNSCKRQIGRIVTAFIKCVDKTPSQIAPRQLKVDWMDGWGEVWSKKLRR